MYVTYRPSILPWYPIKHPNHPFTPSLTQVRNRSSDEVEAGMSAKEARSAEARLFDTDPRFLSLAPEQRGLDALVKKLLDLQLERVLLCLPKVEEQVSFYLPQVQLSNVFNTSLGNECVASDSNFTQWNCMGLTVPTKQLEQSFWQCCVFLALHALTLVLCVTTITKFLRVLVWVKRKTLMPRSNIMSSLWPEKHCTCSHTLHIKL